MRNVFMLTVILLLLLTSVFASMQIVVTIPPLSYAVQRIGGNLVRVVQLLKPGDDPHNYTLSPRQVVEISKAEALVDLGLGEDKWIAQRIKSISPSVKEFNSTKGMEHFLIGVKDAYNPHVWLDVKLYELMCINIYSDLVKLDPNAQKIFSYNLGSFLVELNTLDNQIREELKPYRNKPFVAQHPAWLYFARAYGLGKEYSLENDSGQVLSPEKYQNVIEAMRHYKIDSIIGDPVTPARITATLARDMHAKIVEINPIFMDNYFELMKSITKKFVEAFK